MYKKMKKALVFVLVVVMASVSIQACGKGITASASNITTEAAEEAKTEFTYYEVDEESSASLDEMMEMLGGKDWYKAMSEEEQLLVKQAAKEAADWFVEIID